MAVTFPISAIAPEERPRIIEEATEIFFATGHTTVFNSPVIKHAFYQRWFGRYLDLFPEAFFVSLGPQGEVTGYLAGCLDSFSERARPILNDIAFYTPAFRHALQTFPSHLHINVKPGQQGKGIGALLIGRFFEQCEQNGSTGVHVVTGASSRAVNFYEKCGFRRFVPLSETSPELALLVHPILCGCTGQAGG